MKQTLRYELTGRTNEVQSIRRSVERGYDIVSARVRDGVLTIIAYRMEGADLQVGNLFTPNGTPRHYEMPTHRTERPRVNVPVGFSMKRMGKQAKRDRCLF